jgi:WD40 repeat protein
LRRVEILADADERPAFGKITELDPEPGFCIEGVSSTGRALLVSEEKQTAKVCDPADRGATLRWAVPKIVSAEFSPDGKQVLTETGEAVHGEAAVKVWDVAASPASPPPLPPRLVSSFGDDPGGRVQCSQKGGWVLVTGDKKTELWRYGSWERGPALPADLQGETHHARLSPDGGLVAIEKDGKLHLLDTKTGQPLATCEGTNPAGICVNEVFSADGARLSLLWQYGSVHVWNLTAVHRELTSLGLDWAVAGR